VTSARPLDDRDYRALASFRHALRLFLRFSEDAARREGLTPNQHQLLLAIRGFPGDDAPTIGDVAEHLQLQHHSAVELVTRAGESGLVKRRIDAADRRRQRLELTAKGSRLLARLSSTHRDELRRFRVEMSDLLAELDAQG
jgi:DNA-binding MarR family transcriptional regulator